MAHGASVFFLGSIHLCLMRQDSCGEYPSSPTAGSDTNEPVGSGRSVGFKWRVACSLYRGRGQWQANQENGTRGKSQPANRRLAQWRTRSTGSPGCQLTPRPARRAEPGKPAAVCSARVCVPLATTFVVVRRPKAVTPRRCIAGASRPMAALRSFRLRKSVERQENGGWVGGFLAGPVPAPSGADCYTAPQRCLASATRWQRCPLPFSVCLSDGRPHRTLRLRIVTQRLRI